MAQKIINLLYKQIIIFLHLFGFCLIRKPTLVDLQSYKTNHKELSRILYLIKKVRDLNLS
jgi:hypothetical protein